MTRSDLAGLGLAHLTAGATAAEAAAIRAAFEASFPDAGAQGWWQWRAGGNGLR